MEHAYIKKMKLHFPFIYAEYEDGKKFKYDINEMIAKREEYKKLLDIDFFNQATLTCNGDGILWNDFIDMHGTVVAEFDEEF